VNATPERAVIRAKDDVAPALVHVRPVKEVYNSGKREEVQIVGSGFIITPDGFVVTNEHVAGDSKSVRCVLFNKEEVDATVVGVDPYTDIAVLKLSTPAQNLPHVTLGESKKIVAGQTVLALGSPHGLARSVSMGIVSVTDRYLEDRGDEMISPFNNWIQTDAAINPGNSGGPLVNLKGEVIGVNTRILSGAENVGFAIPIDTAKEVVDQIIKNGRVARSWIGESLQPMRVKTTDPDAKGVIIADVDPLSPGYDAGLRPGDVMLSAEGISTNARFEEDLPAVRKTIADLPIGKEVALKVLRDGKETEIKIKTAERSVLKGDQVEFSEWGFTAVEVTDSIARRAQLPSRSGVCVTGVQAGGIAANARLQNGDIILTMDGAEVQSLTAFRKSYDAVIQSKKPLVMLVAKRGALSRFVLVKQEPGDQSAPASPEPGPVQVEGGAKNGQ
jgi:serine protease Do